MTSWLPATAVGIESALIVDVSPSLGRRSRSFGRWRSTMASLPGTPSSPLGVLRISRLGFEALRTRLSTTPRSKTCPFIVPVPLGVVKVGVRRRLSLVARPGGAEFLVLEGVDFEALSGLERASLSMPDWGERVLTVGRRSVRSRTH
jgi:hypothetical protein